MTSNDFLGEKPGNRDLGQYFDRLDRWIEQNMVPVGDVHLSKLEPTSADANGFAGESFIVEVLRSAVDGAETPQKYLLKRKPTQHQFFPEHDFEAEHGAQAILTASGHAPVAPVAGYESGSGVLDAPFYLLEFVAGEPTPDRPSHHCEGWLIKAPEEIQRQVCTSGLEAIAKLHSRNLTELGAEFMNRSDADCDHLSWSIAKWDRFCAVSWPREPEPVITEARAWLEKNQPSGGELLISWGDARPGNMLFEGGRCNAIIDWDMADAGVLEQDLGYWLAMDLQHERVADQVAGSSQLKAWPSRGEMVDIYQQALGREVDQQQLRFYRILAAYKIACMYARYITMRQDLDDAGRAQFINIQAPPIALVREELDAAHMPGNAT